MKFTLEEYFAGLIPTAKQKKNAEKLIKALNELGKHYKDPVVTIAGLRTPERNAAVGGIKNSPHLTGEAIDVEDKDYKLSKFLLNHLDLLKKYELYMENPFCCTSKTNTKSFNGKTFMNNWIHLQIRKASETVFNP